MPIEVAELNKWVKTDEGKGWLNGQTTELRTNLTNANTKISDQEKDITALGEEKTTLEQSNQTLTADLESARKNVGKPDDELNAKFKLVSGNLENVQKQNATLQKQILNDRLTTLVNDEITKQGGNPKVLGVHVRRQLSAELTEDGQLSVFAVDSNGKKAFDSEAKPAGVGYVVSQLKQDDEFKGNFKASVKKGSGHLNTDDHDPEKSSSKSFMDMDLNELKNTKNIEDAIFN
ncbi:hypothetical protein FCV55_02800 [Vibrio sp. F13]|uniref:hypothetical protein n=1 Tax=Vibrio sp. F13 TaxID=2070777 RepID=UPI0010BD6FB6|nr:hypothetical protein [Vibrio sp. F13]TKF73771.1 hypothetical protein FCV55_02800 [Vibrio sp. F13]